MKTLVLLVVLWAWTASLFAGEIYHGQAFSVWLPIAPSILHGTVQGRLGEAESWKYEGTYNDAANSVAVAYSIESAKGMGSMFLDRSEERYRHAPA